MPGIIRGDMIYLQFRYLCVGVGPEVGGFGRWPGAVLLVSALRLEDSSGLSRSGPGPPLPNRFPAGYLKDFLWISNGFQHVSTDKSPKNRPARFARRIRGAWLVRTALLVSALRFEDSPGVPLCSLHV